MTTPVHRFPPRPKEEVEVPELDKFMQTHKEVRKLLFSSIEEIKEAESHSLEDITEVSFQLQQ